MRFRRGRLILLPYLDTLVHLTRDQTQPGVVKRAAVHTSLAVQGPRLRQRLGRLKVVSLHNTHTHAKANN